MPPLDDNDPLTITLTAREWNQVLAVMGEGRFNIVAPLIAKIHQQGHGAGGEIVSPNGTGHRAIEGESLHVPDR